MNAPGDICYIKRGIYRETVNFSRSGSASAPISFLRFGNENVIVSGLDSLDRRTIRRTQVGTKTCEIPAQFLSNVNRYSQLFLNCKEMVLSRWPNCDNYFDINQFATTSSIARYEDQQDNMQDRVILSCAELPISTTVSDYIDGTESCTAINLEDGGRKKLL